MRGDIISLLALYVFHALRDNTNWVSQGMDMTKDIAAWQQGQMAHNIYQFLKARAEPSAICGTSPAGRQALTLQQPQAAAAMCAEIGVTTCAKKSKPY